MNHLPDSTNATACTLAPDATNTSGALSLPPPRTCLDTRGARIEIRWVVR